MNFLTDKVAQVINQRAKFRKFMLSYDVASESEITPCVKIYKPLVVYSFTGNVMTSIILQRCVHNDKIVTFYSRNEISKKS